MRMNTPVTNVEYELKEGSSIVSKTDLKGIITYVNPDFVEASGFTEKELMGQPHNILRHPDMPEEAFADLWNTLKKGRPWTGIVKNRRKNGDYYWVIANVTPIYEGSNCVGYMSVRSKPTREVVEAHAAAYRLFKEGRQGSLYIKEGKAVRPDPLGGLNIFKGMSFKGRLLSLIALLSLLLVAVGATGLMGMKTTLEKCSDAVTNDWKPHILMLKTTALIQRDHVIILDAINNPAPENIKNTIDEFNKNKDEIERDVKELDRIATQPELKALVARYAVARNNLINSGYVPAIEALRANDLKQASVAAMGGIAPLYEPVRQVEAEITKFYDDNAVGTEAESERVFNSDIQLLVAAILGGVLLAFVVGWATINRVVRSLDHARMQLVRISQGQYHDVINVERADEIGLLMYAMKSMQIRMGFEVSDAMRLANEAMRVQVALDNVGTGVMIADRDRNIIFMNKSVVNLLSRAEADIKKALPSFSVANLLGASMDQFHRNPLHQAQLLANLHGTHATEIALAGHTFALTACPVINDHGERLGSAIEWRDRTTEVAVEQEIATIVNAAAAGDFSRRIHMDDKEGFFKQLGTGMNELMETSAKGLSEIARVLGALAHGDLTEKIANQYQGTFGQLKDDANSTVDQLTEVIRSIKEAADTINTASKEIAAGNTNLSQRTEEQASSLEETAASMEELTSTVKQNAENAKQANQLASGASDIAVRGGQVVGQVVSTMSSISESSKKIVDIISVIDGIAFQTNILALNAAVEAARAGEQGRGFAVVASEVRNLAQRSAAAAKEIKALISDSVDKVAVGTDLVDRAGKTMDEIVTAVKRVTDIMAEISAASVEQSSGIEQVNQAITQMDDVTQQNAALVEEAAAAAESMEEQAQQLATMIGAFKLSVEAESAAPRALPAARAALPARPAAQHVAKAPAPKTPTSKAGKVDDDEWKEF